MQLTYHFLTAVDVEGFSHLNASQQLRVQSDLDKMLTTAATRAGLDRGAWYRQLGGDGELAVLPGDTDGLRLIDNYPRELSRVLTAINRSRNPRLRLRVAIHHGALVDGLFGPAGHAPIVVSRLLDSDALRRELAENSARDLVLAISAAVYGEIVQTGLGRLNPADFHRLDVSAKGTEYPAYIYGGGSRSRVLSYRSAANRGNLGPVGSVAMGSLR